MLSTSNMSFKARFKIEIFFLNKIPVDIEISNHKTLKHYRAMLLSWKVVSS